MKTPREILLGRHRQAEPQLDAIRRRVLAALPDMERAEANGPGESQHARIQALLSRVWLEIIWPSRRAWASLAALWLGLLAANLEMKATSPAAPALPETSDRQIARGFQERQRQLAELLPGREPSPAVQGPRSNPGPRSERTDPFKPC